MDTIKSYLETMFANLPATAEVLKAKDELWGMMEDKYNELIDRKVKDITFTVCKLNIAHIVISS